MKMTLQDYFNMMDVSKNWGFDEDVPTTSGDSMTIIYDGNINKNDNYDEFKDELYKKLPISGLTTRGLPIINIKSFVEVNREILNLYANKKWKAPINTNDYKNYSLEEFTYEWNKEIHGLLSGQGTKEEYHYYTVLLKNCDSVKKDLSIQVKQFLVNWLEHYYGVSEARDPSYDIDTLTGDLINKFMINDNNIKNLSMDFLFDAHKQYEINERKQYIKEFCTDCKIWVTDEEVESLAEEMTDDFMRNSEIVDMLNHCENIWLEDSLKHGTLKEYKKQMSQPAKNVRERGKAASLAAQPSKNQQRNKDER